MTFYTKYYEKRHLQNVNFVISFFFQKILHYFNLFLIQQKKTQSMVSIQW